MVPACAVQFLSKSAHLKTSIVHVTRVHRAESASVKPFSGGEHFYSCGPVSTGLRQRLKLDPPSDTLARPVIKLTSRLEG